VSEGVNVVAIAGVNAMEDQAGAVERAAVDVVDVEDEKAGRSFLELGVDQSVVETEIETEIVGKYEVSEFEIVKL
jgi:hypothetical protein